MKTTETSHFTGNHMTDQQNENPQNQGAAELQSGTDDSSSIRCFRLQDSSMEIPDLEALNLEAFPSSEYMSIPEMIRVCRVIGGEALAWYYRGELAGFSQSLVNRHTAYHTYLAIMPSMRSHGLGQKIIARIIARNLPRQSVLDFEFLDPAAENYGIRKRRKALYLRNGFHETGFYTVLSGDHFEVCCTGGPLDTSSLKDIFQKLSREQEIFAGILAPISSAD